MCSPIGRDYMRSHDALVRLSDGLARSGAHAMRFDYFGTGDSAGEDGEGTVDDWVKDIHVAADELRDMTGLQVIHGVSLRLGATLLATAAAERGDFSRVALCDPISDGPSYLRMMEKLHKEFVLDADRFPTPRRDALAPATQELLGYPFPDAVRASFERLSLLALDRPVGSHTAIFASSGTDAVMSLHRHFAQRHPDVRFDVLHEPIIWEDISQFGRSIIVPKMTAAVRSFLLDDRDA